MNIIEQLAKDLQIRTDQAQAAVGLIDEGNTIPFISRYRKEATGSLNDEVLRALDERLKYLRNLEERKNAVLSSIEEQGKLTPELRQAIETADRLVTVEDLYRPYRPKRRTRAMAAVEKGLRPLADAILRQDCGGDLAALAASFVHEDGEDPQRSVISAEDALRGASDIIAEDISDTASYREAIRKVCARTSVIRTALKNEAAKEKDAKGVYEAYYDYAENCGKVPGHRILALNRGEAEGILNVSLEMPEENILSALRRAVIRKEDAPPSACVCFR